jgi:hypothetical protein
MEHHVYSTDAAQLRTFNVALFVLRGLGSR